MLQFHTPVCDREHPPRALVLCQPRFDPERDITCLVMGDIYEAKEQFCLLCTAILLDNLSVGLLGQVREQLADLAPTQQMRLEEFAEDTG